jgi:hypothetical protein
MSALRNIDHGDNSRSPAVSAFSDLALAGAAASGGGGTAACGCAAGCDTAGAGAMFWANDGCASDSIAKVWSTAQLRETESFIIRSGNGRASPNMRSTLNKAALPQPRVI